MDSLEFLDGAEAPNGEVAPETPAVETPAIEAPVEQETAEQQASRERDDRGRFKAKEADEPIMVPLKALHETRDELRALKAELDRSRQPQAQQPQVPDMFEDPDGYQNYQNQMIQRAIYQERLNISGRFAAQQFGAETVTAAMEWGRTRCVEDPAFNAAVMSNPDPVGYAVQQYQREQMLSQLGGDPKQLQAFLAWKQAQQGQQPTPQPQPERPTSSIAAATSAGGQQHTAIGPGVAFDNVIR